MLSIFYLFLYLVIITSPLILILLTGPITDHGIVYEMGKAFALMGFMIIAMQFVLSSRRKWIERPFGLDMIFSYHKAMAVLAGLLIASHPVLLAIGSGETQLLFSLSLPWNVLLGKVMLLLVILQITISALRKFFHLGFEKWRLTHNLLGGTLIIGIFVHSLVTSHADLNLKPLLYVWIGIFCIGLLFYAHHKFIVPATLKKRPFTITDVRQETQNVWTLEMKPPENERRYHYYPGQFHFITLHRDRNLPREEHHFTISSSPTQPGVVTSSIKESGDFTSTIGKTQKGDTASVEAPFGRFSYLFHPEDKNFVFIAGGIGITPIMSMLRDMRDSAAEAQVLLIYGNHTKNDIVFRQELDEMAAGDFPKLDIVHVLDHPDGEWSGETGYVDQDKLHKLIKNGENKAYYVCCPPAMRKIVLKSLKKMGIKNSQIRVEIFSL